MVEETAAAPAASAPKSPKKAKAGSKKPKVAPTHPKTSEMVNAAIQNLKERGGSSLQAIKKWIAANYKVDVEKCAPFIRKYLKQGVSQGSLVQTKGKGASGSFKLSSSSSKEKPTKAGNKTEKPKKVKAAKPKKSVKAKPAKGEKKVVKPKKPKAPKPKKAVKPKASKPKKPKSPKPKTAKPKPKKASPKKAAKKA